MSLRSYSRFAAYNAWANARLYAAAERLGDAKIRQDGGAFFGSIVGTLNHLLVADRIWMARFQNLPSPGLALDSILFEDLPLLKIAREAQDMEIREFVDALTEARFAEAISYTNSSGQMYRQTLSSALDHFFNHQTHHRGQVHALLTALGGGRAAAPSLDLLVFQRESAGA